MQFVSIAAEKCFPKLSAALSTKQMSHSELNVLVCLVSKSPSVMSYAVTAGALNEVESLRLVVHISPDLLRASGSLNQPCVKHGQGVHHLLNFLIFFNILFQWLKSPIKVLAFRGPSTEDNSDI